MNKSLYESTEVSDVIQSIRSQEKIYEKMEAMELALMGYLLTGKNEYLESHENTLKELQADTTKLLKVQKENTELVLLKKNLLEFVNKKIGLSKELIAAKQNKASNNNFIATRLSTGNQILDSIQNSLLQLGNWDRAFLKEANNDRQAADRKTNTLFFILSGLLFLLLFSGFFIIRSSQLRIDKYEKELAYLASLVNQTSDAIISTDTNSIIKSWNQGAEYIYGYSKEDAIGKNVATLLALRKEEKNNGSIYNSDSEKAVFISGEYEARKKNGESMTVIASFNSLKNQKNEVTGYICVQRDISERKKLEKELKQLNEDLEKQVKEKTSEIRHIFERITDAFIAIDTSGRITYINEKASKILAIDIKQAVGRNLIDYFPVQQWNRRFRKAFDNSLNHQENSYIEIFSSVYSAWFEINIYPSSSGLSFFFRDITEKKKNEIALVESEEKYRSLIEQASDGIFIASKEGRFIEVNVSAQNLTGYTKDELLNLSLTDLIFRQDLEPLDFQLATLSIEKVITIQRRLRRKDGSLFVAELSTKTLPSENHISFVRDITIRKKAEDDIRKANERFELISRATNDAIWEWDLESGYTWGNEMHQEIYGLTKEDPIPQEDEWLTKMDPAERRRIKMDFDNALESSSSIWTAEYRFIFENGEIKNIYDRTYIQRNEKGKPVRLLGSMMDISPVRKAEEAIKISEEKYRTLVEQATDAIIVGNPEGKFIEANTAALILFGYTLEEIKELYIHDILLIDKEDPPLKFKELQEGRSVLSNRVARRKDGSVFFIEINSKMLPNGNFLGFARDITERKNAEKALLESENRIRTILATEPECIKLVGPEGELLEMNPAGLAMIEADNLESVVGKRITSVILPLYRDAFMQLTRDVFEGKSGILEFEIIGLKGTHRWLETHAVPFKSAGGDIIAALGVTRDITEKKKVSEELRLSEEKYRLLFRNSPLPIWVFDKESFTILDVNDAAIEHYGYQRSEYLSMNIKDLRPPEEISKFLAATSLANSGLRQHGTWTHKKKNGDLIKVDIWTHDILYNNQEARLALAIDITEKLIAEQKIIETSDQLRQLTSRLQYIREEERKYIAREIHDELGQRLTVLKMDISWLNRKLKTDDEIAKEKIRNTLTLLDGTIKIVRKIATDLRPGILDDLGLIPALEWQSKEFEERSGISVRFHSNMPELTFPTLMSTVLFRVFQESLTNVGRHAEAMHIESELMVEEDYVTLTITDDGKGFDTASLGKYQTLGIMGMKERTLGIGGEYAINSIPGKGTIVTVRIPVKIEEKISTTYPI